MKRSLFAAALLMSTVWAVVPAHAQVDVDRGRNVAVNERPRPEYDALGTSVGAFSVFPSVTFGAEYNDNVFAEDDSAPGVETDSDIIFTVRPYISAHSNWGRHSLSASVGATQYAHRDFDSEDRTDAAANIDGRLDVYSDTWVGAGLGYQDNTEPRTAAEAGPGGALVDYTVARGYVSAGTTLNRVRVTTRAEQADYDFEDNGIDQDYRDHKATYANVRAEYALSPDTAFVVQAGANERDYDQAGSLRDSKGWEALVGINTDINNLIRGELIVGQTSQDYDDPGVGTIEGLAVRANVQWFPTEMTTVTFTGARDVQDTGVVGSAGVLTTREAVRVDHELLRNVILTGGVQVTQAEYGGIDRDDDWLDADIGARYLMNRHVELNAGYSFSNYESDGTDPSATRDFKVNRVRVGLTLKL